jgi:two-component system, OmpR family, KDP operon response regulator KdpE
MTRVLVIDDEAPFVRALGISLRARGYEVDTAGTGEDGLRLAADRHPDAVILDLGLPGIDGLEVLAALRAWSAVPVLVLSARHTEEAKVMALDSGADDYVTKPFTINELFARLRAVVRRHVPVAEQAVVSTEDFTIDLGAKTVTTTQGPVRLTPTEWRIVEELVRSEGRLVSQRQLLQHVWGPQYETETDYLRTYLASLRRKLEPNPATPRYFITEPGMGYRFRTDQAAADHPADRA